MIDHFCSFLFLMTAGHALCDFPLQPGSMSVAKRPGGDPSCPWQMILLGHSFIHGGAVALITGHWWLGALETGAHALIDLAKCRDLFSTKTDQALHLACKAVWAAVAVVCA